MTLRCTVTIRCDDRAHARGKVARIETFARFDFGDGVVFWMKMGNQGRSVARLRGVELEPSRIDGAAIERERHEGIARTRFDLRCKLCGLTVPATKETLVPVLDALAASDVGSITLAGLAARLSGKN